MTLRSGVYIVPTNRRYIERSVWLIAGVVLLALTAMALFMQTDKWYLERHIYLAVGINISVASVLMLAYSACFPLFMAFVGGAMVWANGLYWLGAEPRLAPESLPSGRCTECPKSCECLGGHPILARGADARRIEPPASGLIGVRFAVETEHTS
jgi:hypothetical protein